MEPVVGFALAMVPIVATPGASFTLMTTHVLTSRRVVRRVVAGTALGILCHAVLAVFGLSMLVMRSAELYRLVQLAGALYLIGLGIAALRGGRAPSAPPRDLRVRTAFLANLLNPKAAAVYLTVVPQFLDHNAFTPTNVLVLASAHIVLTAVWLGASGVALRSLGGRRIPARAIARIGGVVLIALGLKSLAPLRSLP